MTSVCTSPLILSTTDCNPTCSSTVRKPASDLHRVSSKGASLLLALAPGLFLPLAVQAVPPVDFRVPPSFAVGGYAWQIVTADVNEDRIDDLLTADFMGNTVTVLAGHGDGTFSTATNYFLGGRWAAVGDFDRDGSHDLALNLGGKVGILFNQTVPRMQISRTAEGVRIARPAWKPYQLQAVTGDAATEAWEPLDVTPATNGSQFVTTNTPTGQMQLFRLEKQ